MNTNETEILKVVHGVDKKIDVLTTTVEEGIVTRLKEHDRRIHNLEVNQRWVVLGILGIVVGAIMNTILK